MVVKPSFKWADFFYPSTLNLSSFLETLLEPVVCIDTLNRVKLGLHEALVNAVIHGNLKNPEKKLRVRRVLTPHWLVWQIQDEGDGLMPSKRLNSLPVNLDAENGRGMFLIHQSFDDVRWSRKGNRMQLSVRRKNS